MNKVISSYSSLRSKAALVQRTRFALIHEPEQGEFTYSLINFANCPYKCGEGSNKNPQKPRHIADFTVGWFY